ncbi:hypothetical protein [Nonomuraea endophytica]|uniref:hypothetical protein n=1 Tax=Nonomuraea endophytica TaxID=714136 RepID=UPI0037C82CB4
MKLILQPDYAIGGDVYARYVGEEGYWVVNTRPGAILGEREALDCAIRGWQSTLTIYQEPTGSLTPRRCPPSPTRF